MGFTEQAALAQDETFRAKVRIALMTAVISVMGEAEGAFSSTEYGKRQTLAFDVLKAAGGGILLEAFSWGVAANPAVTASSTDSDIQFTVNSLIDDMAGVRGTD